ncbi:MAG: cell division protein FtsZ [Bryobacteraceae bacterium]|nr:cell division protein FtsZ [Bryobacteraceae bacterium]MDW8379368.1 cell division protein FtsZ [Bryobacterales bacterium]
MPQSDSKLDALKFEIAEDAPAGTRIKVIGIGGAGCNAASRMYKDGIAGVEFYALDTDRQALSASPIPNKLLIGSKVTNGLGSGADPAIGKQAALEDTERMIEILEGADMVFLSVGLGGGTGTGAAPVVASLAKELNALTVCIVTKPFAFEGAKRMQAAEQGVEELASTVDTLIQIPNERLTAMVPKGTSLLDAFRVADDVLRQAVIGISDIMNTPGLINRDFSDIRAIMQGMGYAMMGTAVAKGPNAAVEAARSAISNPFFDDHGIRGARGILINITASSRIPLHDIHDACSLIRNAAENEEVQVDFGFVLDEKMGEDVKITVIATGFPAGSGDLARQRVSRGGKASMTSTPAAEPAPEPWPAEPERQEIVAPVAVASALPHPVTSQPPDSAAATLGVSPAGQTPPDEPLKGTEDLEIPAFLRRQERRFL